MVAKWTGDFLSCVTKKGIYDMHIIELKHVPLLEQAPEKELITIQVREVMARNPVTFDAVETVGKLLDTLESYGHNGFPVLYPGTRRLVGLLRRSVLHRLLENAIEKEILQAPTGPVRKIPPIPFEEIAFKRAKCETYEQLRLMLDPRYLEYRFDLRPYVNRNGYQMPKHASVASCFSLFRKLGLRHLPIVAANGDLCGIVTRKDLILCEDADASPPAPCADDSDDNSMNTDDGGEEVLDSHSDEDLEAGDFMPPTRSQTSLPPTRSQTSGPMGQHRTSHTSDSAVHHQTTKKSTFAKSDSGFFGGGGM